MGDDRALETPEAAIGRVGRELAELRKTVAARLARRPVGDVEPAIRATPKEGTVFLQGQTLPRADYAALAAWAELHGGAAYSVTATTITLPDMRGRTPVGVGTLGADSYDLGGLSGAARVTLAEAQMPLHDHSGSTGSESHSHGGSTGSDSHSHGGSTSNDGQHWNHRPSSTGGIAGGGGTVVASNEIINDGDHSHSVNVDSSSHSHSMNLDSDSHSHTVSVGNAGGTTPVDLRQPGYALNWAVWT